MLPYLSNNWRALLFNVASRTGPPRLVQTKRNVYFATPKLLPTTRRFLSTLKGGRRPIAKVYTHPRCPALLSRPGGTFFFFFFSQTPVLSVNPSCVPPLPALPSSLPTAPQDHTFTSEAWQNAKQPSKCLCHTFKPAAGQVRKWLGAYLHIRSMERPKKLQNEFAPT